MEKEMMIKVLQLSRKNLVFEQNGEYREEMGGEYSVLLAPENYKAFRLNEKIESGSRVFWAEITKETEKAVQITCYRQRRDRITEVSDWYPKSQMLQINENTWAMAEWMRGQKNYYAPILLRLTDV